MTPKNFTPNRPLPPIPESPLSSQFPLKSIFEDDPEFISSLPLLPSMSISGLSFLDTPPTYTVYPTSQDQIESKALTDLKKRLPLEFAITINSLGVLHLVEILTLRRSHSSIMNLYLFDDAILCVREPKKKFLRSKSSQQLEIRGRVNMKDIKRVYDSSIANEFSLTIEMKSPHDPFSILFPSHTTLELWRATLNMVIAGYPNFNSPISSTSSPSSLGHSLKTSSSSSASSVSSTTTKSTMYTNEPAHQGYPRGKEIPIGSVYSYLTSPPEHRPGDPNPTKHFPTYRAADGKIRVIILVSDISGWRVASLRIMADKMANLGYLVIIPDLFAGDIFTLDKPAAWSYADQFQAKHTPEIISTRLGMVIDACKFKLAADSIAMVGYGFGAQYAIWYNAIEQVDVSIAMTPTSLQVEAFAFARIRRPMLCIKASDDGQTSSWLIECERIVRRTHNMARFSTFPGTTRRFALHPMSNDDNVAAYFALEDTIRFIEENI